MTRLGLTIAILLSVVCLHPLGWSHADSPPARWTFSGTTMGPVPYSVVLGDRPVAVTRKQIESTITNTLADINRLMSTYLDDSEISQFNASKSTDWFSVDLQTAQVVKRALELTKFTNAAFDIRVGKAVNRWNFGPDKQTFQPPTDEEIAQLVRTLRDGTVEARLDPPAIRKSLAATAIDLSAIAKGYAVDQVANALAKLDCQNVMVEIGGEVFAQGYRSTDDGDKEPWRLGIERPSAGTATIEAKVPLSGQALATSGDYRNFFEHQGKRYSHTIDPTTCRPVEHYLASASVIAQDCMTADALATAIMVMGAQQGHKFAEKNSIPLHTIDRNGGFEGALVVKKNQDFPLLPQPKTEPSAGSIWPTFLAALLVFAIAITGMAVGAIFANKPVTGSCGGLSAMSGSDEDASSCSVCAKPVTDCVERQPETS